MRRAPVWVVSLAVALALALAGTAQAAFPVGAGGKSA